MQAEWPMLEQDFSVFDLPDEPSQDDSQEESAADGEAKEAKKKIVIVDDDDEDMLDMLGALFRDLGVIVETFHCAREAATYILSDTEGDVDLVILDVLMPKFGGVDFLEVMEVAGVLSQKKIVVYSGHLDAALMVQRFGVPVVTKPCESGTVLTLLAA